VVESKTNEESKTSKVVSAKRFPLISINEEMSKLLIVERFFWFESGV
jgi:hypothetical protein